MQGADRGKTGKVLHAYPKKNKVLIEGINIKKKHQRARSAQQKGQIIEKPHPVNVANVAIMDPQKNVGTRVGISRTDGKRVRIAKKSGVVIEK